MDGNYIKLNRSLLTWEWYGDINTSRLFLHLLLKANWKEERYQGTTVPRGSLVTTLPKLSKETGLSIRQTRTCLERLKMTGEVTDKTTNKNRIISVKNYDKYQNSDRQTGSQSTDNRQANGQSIDRPNNKRSKERKEVNNINNNNNNNIQSTSYSCPELENPASVQTFIGLPLIGGVEYQASVDEVTEWKELYPAVDVEQELRKMRGWLLADPKRRKTSRGIKRFVTGWLAREQDRGGTRQRSAKGLEDWVNDTG